MAFKVFDEILVASVVKTVYDYVPVSGIKGTDVLTAGRRDGLQVIVYG
ncbi:hypothetical protein LPYR103PRE_08840 [Segatella asaccharophila]